ncbi:lipocalin-like [Thalassophryne amazonica]|uniref:lipocalin-like n=1 Tax=Thalassophryne amazonica TaxID=390379 RepID=UPI001471D0E2|nr:lipocalin-like [Thalassophryne amazonica]
MRKTLLVMLVGLLAVLTVCADVTPDKDFKIEKVVGKWFRVGISSNAKWFNKDKMRMGTAILKQTEGGGMSLTFTTLQDDGTCWNVTHLANKTDTPGHFRYYSQIWNNTNDLYIVKAEDDVVLTHTVKTSDRGTSDLISLYSNQPESNANMAAMITKYSQEHGILADNVVMLPKNAECPS